MLMALFGPRGAAFSSFTSQQVWFVIYSLVFCSFLIEPFCGVSLRVHLRLHSCNESHKLMIRFHTFFMLCFCSRASWGNTNPVGWARGEARPPLSDADEMALDLNPVWNGRFLSFLFFWSCMFFLSVFQRPPWQAGQMTCELKITREHDPVLVCDMKKI